MLNQLHMASITETTAKVLNYQIFFVVIRLNTHQHAFK